MLDVPLTQPTSEHIRGLPFGLKPPKGFLSLYPGIRSEFQIRIRVSVWISCIRYLLKHISPSPFLLSSFAGPPKGVLSCVLLLLSPGDEWHIRDSLQLIPSFMLCESKLWACSPFALYLLSFEIILNVMLNVRWELAAFLNFTQSAMCLSETQETQTSKRDKNSSSQAVGYCWSCSRKHLMNALAACLSSLHCFGLVLVLKASHSAVITGLQTPGDDICEAVMIQIKLHPVIYLSSIHKNHFTAKYQAFFVNFSALRTFPVTHTEHLQRCLLVCPAGGAAELAFPAERREARQWHESGPVPRALPDLPFPSAAHTLSAGWALSLSDWTEPLNAHLTLSLSCTWLCFHSPFYLLCVSWLSLSTLFEQR